MTIINPKSITGVTSITTPSGSDNLFTVHTNNTTERIRINSDGDVIVGSGITVSPDGDIFATGVCTATSFVGSGANLTGVASTENIRTNTNATFLQNINVSGSTTTGSLVSSGAISGTTGTFSGDVTANGGDMTISGSSAILHLVDTNDNPNYRVQNIGGTFQIYDATTDTARLAVEPAGNINIAKNLNVSGLTTTGIISAFIPLVDAMLTNSGNFL